MGILGFGSVAKLEDLKIDDLKKESLNLQVKQDQLLTRIRRAQEQYEGILDAASEPGLNEAEIDVASYKAELAFKTKTTTENELQEIITRSQLINSTMDILTKKQELEKKGIWKTINSIPQDQLEGQLHELAAERKEESINLNAIVDMFSTDTTSVKANRSADFRRIRDSIVSRREDKTSD
jgi:hypothetical protein|tara:strand:+ start:808 stop:1350 length:543 start_codon:yes stop_codon:yes gene_type:complete